MVLPRSQHYGLVAFSLFNAVAFERAIFFLFFIDRGHTAIEISGLQVLLFVTIFLAEIPTGIFGDIYGKKMSLMVGCGLKGAALILQYTSAGNLPILAMSFALYGLSLSFISGSFSALMFETLKRNGVEGRFARLAVKIEFLDSFALAMSIAIGPFVKSFGDWQAVYGLTALASGIAMLTLLPVFEPAPPKLEGNQANIENRFNLSIWRRSIKRILYLIVPMALLHACMTPVFVNMQLVLTELGASLEVVGISIGAVELVSAFLVFALMKKEIAVTRINLAVICIIVAVLGSLNLIGYWWLSIGLFFVMNGTVILAHVSQSAAVHQATASDHIRASTMSFVSFCDTIAISGGYLLFGFASKWLSYTASLSLLAIFPVIALIPALVMRQPNDMQSHMLDCHEK